jgi:hypothetical protein
MLFANAISKKEIGSHRWVIVENGRGYGKSTLMKEFASRRSKDFFCEGPSLFTDFRNIANPNDVEALQLETIAPFFFEIYPLTLLAG